MSYTVTRDHSGHTCIGPKNARRSLPAVMLMVVMLVSVQCLPERTSVEFHDGDKLTKRLEMEPVPGLKLNMNAIVGIGAMGEFDVTLYLTVPMLLTDSLQWNKERVRAIYKDSLLHVTALDHGHPSVSRAKEADLTIQIMGRYEKDELWTGVEMLPQIQQMSIVLDKVIVWNGKPVHLDTIRAVLNPGPYPY